MNKYKKETRLCTIIVIISSIFYFWTRFWRFSSGFICPLFHVDSFIDFGLYAILAISFITALVLGLNNIRLMLYPVFTAVFIWLVPPVVYSLLYNQVHFSNMMYYMFYTFIIILMGQLILAYLGLGIGLLIFLLRNRKTKRNI